jgi:TrmH family RNA methyltransferase
MSARQFLAEGPQAVREALARPGCVVAVFATYDAGDRHPDLISVAQADPGVEWQLVDEAALASLTETVTPQGVVAVCNFVDVGLDELLGRLIAVCADIRDPGNAGTVLRSADAAGADGVVLAGSSVDPYNGKAVRASAGSVFHVPISIGSPVDETVASCRRAGLTVLAADGSGATTLDDLIDAGSLVGPTAWLFGNEARGLPDELLASADDVVRVPIYGRAESLNLATAAAVCLYASARVQRGRSGPTVLI